MEILKRAKGKTDGEVVSCFADEKSVREEVNYRTWKAGYTTRLGEPTYGTKVQGLIFWGNEKLNVWPRDEHGNLIGD